MIKAEGNCDEQTHKIALPENSLPFKGRAGVGMGCSGSYDANTTHPPPDLPLERGGIRASNMTKKDSYIADAK